MKSERIFLIILSLTVITFIQGNKINTLQLRNYPGLEFFNSRLEVIRENFNLRIGATVQCKVLNQESVDPSNETSIKEYNTTAYDNIVYLNTTTPGCLKFDVRSEIISIALTDQKNVDLPIYAITLNYPNSNGKPNVMYSAIRKQPTVSDDDIIIAETPNILDGSEYRSFELNWDIGKIEISKKDDSVPFLSITDPRILTNSFTLVGLKSHELESALWKLKDLDKECGAKPGTLQKVLVQCWSWN